MGKKIEALSKRINVNILNYHADNGRFVDKKFIKHARDNGQVLDYIKVNAHFQNSNVERRI
jgi:uncharacterized protein YozE (UPF0346 family)